MMTSLKRVTAPATTPVSLAEAKAHLRVDGSDEDALITALIDSATQRLDGWSGILGRALIAQTWDLYLDAFPPDAIRIPLGPLIAVDGVFYIDEADVQQQVAPADYVVDDKASDGWIVPAGGFVWPSPISGINTVRVRFTAGYGAPADVPAPIRAAILLMIGDLYAHRETAAVGSVAAVKVESSMTVNALLAPYRRVML